MIEALLTFLFTMFEYAAPLCFCIVLWRLRFKNNIFMNIVFISSILSVLSYLCNLYAQNISVVVSVSAFYVCFRLFFKTRPVYSLLITASGYLAATVVQIAIVSLLLVTGSITSDQIQPFTFIAYAMQLSTFILSLIISLFIKSSGKGFAFVPEETFTRKKLQVTNAILVIISLLALIALTIGYFMIYSFDISVYSVLALICISFTATILLDDKRDSEEFA